MIEDAANAIDCPGVAAFGQRTQAGQGEGARDSAGREVERIQTAKAINVPGQGVVICKGEAIRSCTTGEVFDVITLVDHGIPSLSYTCTTRASHGYTLVEFYCECCQRGTDGVITSTA